MRKQLFNLPMPWPRLLTGVLLAVLLLLPMALNAQVTWEETGDAPEEVTKEDVQQFIDLLSPIVSPDNSGLRLMEAGMEYPVLAEPWEEGTQTGSDPAFAVAIYMAGLQAFASSLVLPLLISIFVSVFIASFAASKLLAPRHATLRNALILAAVPVLLLLVIMLLVQFGNTTVAVLGAILVLVAIVISMVIATMYIYDIGFLSMLLFAILGNVISSFLCGIIFFIMMNFMGNAMFGPISESVGVAYAEQSKPYLDKKLASLTPKLKQLDAETIQAKEELESLTKQESDMQAQLKAKQQEAASKRQTPQLVYTSIGQLVDQNRLNEAIASYAEFAAKFSGHPLSAAAKEQITLLEGKMAQDEAQRAAERAAAIKKEKERLAAFKSNLAKGKITLSEIRSNLLGKTREEVIELVGTPDGEQANVLIYTKLDVLDPVRGKNRPIIINFLDGRVQGISYIR